jgi:hypothetical protein
MSQLRIASLLAAMGAIAIDEQTARDRQYLEQHGWVCLGAECTSSQVHWTNLERGLGEGGPVTFYRAIHLQRTADAIAKRQSTEAQS